MYFLLIALLICLLILNMHLFRNDIFCPPVALNGTFLFCASFGLLRYREWDLPSYGWQAVVCIIGGLSIFSMVSYVAQIIVFPRRKIHITRKLREERIEVNSFFLLMAVFFNIFFTFLSFYHIQSVVSQYYNVSTFSKVVFSYRNLSNNVSITLTMPAYLKVAGIIFNVCLLVSAFILTHNILFGIWKKIDILHIVMCLTGVFQSFFGGGRTQLLILLSMLLYMAVFFLHMRYGFRSKVEFILIRRAVALFVGFLVIFLLLNVGLGRSASFSELDVINYLGAYISGGIRNLDFFMKAPPTRTALSGHETFFALSRKFVADFNAVRHLEFRFIRGVSSGNVYTAFRRFYSDFGVSGVVILTAIQAAIFSSLYFTAKRNAMKGRISFLMFLFCSFSYTIFYIAIDDLFYSSVLSVATIFRIITSYVIFHTIVQKDIIITCGNRKLI